MRNYAAKLVRNLAIDVYRRKASRGNEMPVILEELEGVLGQVEDSYEKLEWKEIINGFLESLDKKNRMLFICRYWQAESIKELSVKFQMKESAVKMRLNRTREKFRVYLEKEGIAV